MMYVLYVIDKKKRYNPNFYQEIMYNCYLWLEWYTAVKKMEWDPCALNE